MTASESVVAGDALDVALGRFFAQDGPAMVRVTRAATTVRFLVEDDPDASVTLLLDRRPAALLVGADVDAEITIRLTAEQAGQLATGRLVLPTALLHGVVRSTGPVRKFLAVDPIVRAALREASGGDR